MGFLEAQKQGKNAAAYVLPLSHPLTFQLLSASLQQYAILNKHHS